MQTDEELDSKYILYNLGSELYGTPLLTVKEVIKFSPPKTVPYMVPHFLGVINLRGQIVGIVDLRLKFDIGLNRSEGGMVLVIESGQGLIGALVDEIVSVEKIHAQNIEPKPMIETKIPEANLIGIAKLDRGLVNIIDLAGCLATEEFRRAQGSAASL